VTITYPKCSLVYSHDLYQCQASLNWFILYFHMATV